MNIRTNPNQECPGDPSKPQVGSPRAPGEPRSRVASVDTICDPPASRMGDRNNNAGRSEENTRMKTNTKTGAATEWSEDQETPPTSAEIHRLRQLLQSHTDATALELCRSGVLRATEAGPRIPGRLSEAFQFAASQALSPWESLVVAGFICQAVTQKGLPQLAHEIMNEVATCAVARGGAPEVADVIGRPPCRRPAILAALEALDGMGGDK